MQQILKEVHDSPTGHFGVNKTLEKIRKHFFGPPASRMLDIGMKAVKSVKRPSNKGKSSFQIFDAGILFERIQINILGPLLTSFSENKYLLVITDCIK